MRKTYLEAEHVLVLDASLQCYDTRRIGVLETLARIFTAGWMHRLWTLQEGALAKKLWFQFQKEPVDIDKLVDQLDELYGEDIRAKGFTYDMREQKKAIRGKFRALQQGHDRVQLLSQSDLKYCWISEDLHALDTTLKYRSTSVASDEALCIGTLLGLPMDDLLEVPTTESARMGKVWDLVAWKYDGIPQEMIFWASPRMRVKGYRWAPISLLCWDQRLLLEQVPSRRNMHPRSGFLDQDGLLVQFPGFLVYARPWKSDITKNPFGEFGFGYNAENRFIFSGEDGRKYVVLNKLPEPPPTTEAERQRRRQNPGLKAIIHSGSAALIMKIYEFPPQYDPITGWDCTIVSIKRETDNILYVHTQSQGSVADLLSEDCILFDAAARLARGLREDPVMVTLVELMDDQTSLEYQNALKDLREEILQIVLEALEDVGLVRAARFWAAPCDFPAHEVLWLIVAELCFHDFVGIPLPLDQRWCVD